MLAIMDKPSVDLKGKACAICTSAATQICTGCNLKYYCSAEHEQEDWAQHITKCRPFKVESNDKLGRYLVATRNINAGEIILKEKPLVSGPPQSDVPVCIACYNKLSRGCPRCILCGWPTCSDECTPIDTHRAECEWTRYKMKGKMNIAGVESSQPIYKSLIVLRCLYQRETDPETWNKLLELESHSKKRMKSGKYQEDRIEIARGLQEYFKLYDDFSEDLILQMCGVVQVNSYFNHLTEPHHIGIYDIASFIEHNCKPNCAKTFTTSDELMIRAVLPIFIGEHLSISYVDQTWGTAKRRYNLKKELLECHCRRCEDPTELGTYYSALICLKKDCGGFVLPENAAKDMQKEPDGDDEGEEEEYTGRTYWKCSTCSNVMASVEVYKFLKEIVKEWKKLKETDIKGQEKLLKELEGKILHPNHYIIIELKTNLALNYGRTSEKEFLDLSYQQLERKITLCRQVLDLGAILFPADSRSRGMLMFELQEAIAEEAKRKLEAGELKKRELKHALQESEELLDVADRMLSGEPDVLPEGEVAVAAKKRLLDIEKAQEDGISDASIIISN